MAELVRLGDVATVAQGMNLPGRAKSARPHAVDPRARSSTVRFVSVGDIQDDRLAPDGIETTDLEPNARVGKHFLQPDDVLVSARSTIVKAALVPPSLNRAVADATLLVVRADEPGLGRYLWWFLTSTAGRRRVLGAMKGSTTLLFLSATSLTEIELPLPEPRVLDRLVDLVEASERAYTAATDAAHLRRETIRDALIERLWQASERDGGEE